ncbi:MAG TPA: hypothetical protein VF735_14870 [Pyrinomonadaceae bacterium]
MSASIKRPSSAAEIASLPDGLSSSQATPASSTTLAELPVGSHLILRCRKDWRDATVVAVSPEQVTLSVGSPGGHTYRVKRPASTPVLHEGPIPVLGEGSWRPGLVRYDTRW